MIAWVLASTLAPMEILATKQMNVAETDVVAMVLAGQVKNLADLFQEPQVKISKNKS
jgi:hypothetical protein